jgi:hypothetical protein
MIFYPVSLINGGKLDKKKRNANVTVKITAVCFFLAEKLVRRFIW